MTSASSPMKPPRIPRGKSFPIPIKVMLTRTLENFARCSPLAAPPSTPSKSLTSKVLLVFLLSPPRFLVICSHVLSSFLYVRHYIIPLDPHRPLPRPLVYRPGLTFPLIVSTKHAEIVWECVHFVNAFLVKDLGSANGTFLNEEVRDDSISLIEYFLILTFLFGF